MGRPLFNPDLDQDLSLKQFLNWEIVISRHHVVVMGAVEKFGAPADSGL